MVSLQVGQLCATLNLLEHYGLVIKWVLWLDVTNRELFGLSRGVGPVSSNTINGSHLCTLCRLWRRVSCRIGSCRMGRLLGIRICTSHHPGHTSLSFISLSRRHPPCRNQVNWRLPCQVSRHITRICRCRQVPHGLLGSIQHRDLCRDYNRDDATKGIFERECRYGHHSSLSSWANGVFRCQDCLTTL